MLADGIVGDDVKNEIVGMVVDNLVGLVRFEEEGVAGENCRRPVLVANRALTRNDVVKLPLRAVRVVRVRRLTRRNAQNLDVEWMPLVQVSGGWLPSERFGYLFAGASEFALGRRPRQLFYVLGIDFKHIAMRLPRADEMRGIGNER